MQSILESLNINDNASNTASLTRPLTRRTEDCGPSKNFIFTVGSRGLSESELLKLFGYLDKTKLFGDFAGAFCSFTLNNVVIDVSTGAPTTVPKAFEKSNCVSSCRAQYSVDKYSCRD